MLSVCDLKCLTINKQCGELSKDNDDGVVGQKCKLQTAQRKKANKKPTPLFKLRKLLPPPRATPTSLNVNTNVRGMLPCGACCLLSTVGTCNCNRICNCRLLVFEAVAVGMSSSSISVSVSVAVYPLNWCAGKGINENNHQRVYKETQHKDVSIRYNWNCENTHT